MASSPTLLGVDAAELARCLFDESKDALLIFDPDNLQIIDVNPRAQELTQLSRKQLLQTKLAVLFDAESRDLLRVFIDSCHWTQSFDSEQAYRLACDDGEPCKVNVTVSRLNTKPNSHCLVALRDVSECETHPQRPQASLEAELESQSVSPESTSSNFRVTEEWLREIVNDVDAIVWEAELPSWQFTYVSQHAETILGYPVSQWLNEVDFWVTHVHDDDRERCVKFCTECTKRCEDHEFDYRAIAKDGRIVWLHEIVRVVMDENGAPSRLRGVMFDITDRKNDEEALRESEEQRQRTEEIALVMKVDLGLDGCWLKVPSSFCDSLGYSRNELIGAHWREITHVDDRAEGERQNARLLAGEIKTFEREKRHISQDGRIVWNYINASLVVNRAGEPQFFRTYIRDITEKKAVAEALRKSEEKLRQSEQRLKHLISNCPVTFYTCRASGDYGATYVSKTITSQTGYETQEFIDDAGFWANHIHPDDRERVISELSKLPEQGHVSDEYRFLNKNGTYRWMYDESSILPGIDGHPEEIIGFWMDITKRKLAEESLQQSEARYRSLVEGAPVCIHEIDLNRRLESINLAGLKMVGVESESDLAGQEYLSFVDEKDRARISSLLDRAFNGEASSFEFASNVNSDRRLYSSNFIPITSQSGEVQKVMGTTEDITERRSAVEELRANEEKFRVLTEKSAAIVLIVQAHRIVYGNAMLTAISGYSLDEISRLRFLDLIHPDDRDLVAQRYHQRLTGGSPPQRYEFRIVTKNGETRWIDYSGQLIDFKGAPAILATSVDVTDRKTAEEQLRQKELQLAHVSRLSTMGEMVAGIAHEINQPLSAIANYAAASRNALGAMTDEDNSQIATWLQHVNEQAVCCGEIIRRLRDFVTKDNDDPECVELNEVVHDSVALIQSTLRHQSVIIDCQIPESSPQVMASHVQLQQVLLNLLRNACEAAFTSTTPRIIVLVDIHDGHARVSVEDNGPGVEDSDRPRLFDTFFTTKPDGMGMGLPISKSIVEAHGGSLRFDAEHSEGARFHIEFPIAETAKANNTNVG